LRVVHKQTEKLTDRTMKEGNEIMLSFINTLKTN